MCLLASAGWRGTVRISRSQCAPVIVGASTGTRLKDAMPLAMLADGAVRNVHGNNVMPGLRTMSMVSDGDRTVPRANTASDRLSVEVHMGRAVAGCQSVCMRLTSPARCRAQLLASDSYAHLELTYDAPSRHCNKPTHSWRHLAVTTST